MRGRAGKAQGAATARSTGTRESRLAAQITYGFFLAIEVLFKMSFLGESFNTYPIAGREMAPNGQEDQVLVSWEGLKETRKVKKDDFHQVKSTEAVTSHIAVTAASLGNDDNSILAALAVDIEGSGA